MHFAVRNRIKIAFAVLAIYALLVALLARFWPPPGASFQEAFLRWSWGIPATLVVWFCAEWLSSKVLSLPFWSRMPSWARVALLVLVVLAVVVLLIGLSNWSPASSAA